MNVNKTLSDYMGLIISTYQNFMNIEKGVLNSNINKLTNDLNIKYIKYLIYKLYKLCKLCKAYLGR